MAVVRETGRFLAEERWWSLLFSSSCFLFPRPAKESTVVSRDLISLFSLSCSASLLTVAHSPAANRRECIIRAERARLFARRENIPRVMSMSTHCKDGADAETAAVCTVSRSSVSCCFFFPLTCHFSVLFGDCGQSRGCNLCTFFSNLRSSASNRATTSRDIKSCKLVVAKKLW